MRLELFNFFGHIKLQGSMIFKYRQIHLGRSARHRDTVPIRDDKVMGEIPAATESDTTR